MKIVHMEETLTRYYGYTLLSRYVQAAFPLDGILCEIEVTIDEEGNREAEGTFYKVPRDLLIELSDLILNELSTSALVDVLFSLSVQDLLPVEEVENEKLVEITKRIMKEHQELNNVIIVKGGDITNLLPPGDDLTLFVLDEIEIRKVSKDINVDEFRRIIGKDIKDIWDVIDTIRVKGYDED
ncbi:hypothetical protein PNA2_0530 [Pyrococcus sp. NA2]|uniref:hypothetical protein n=1 Tax=Pyrococcus sp. (strain NA2) TaxID=342949 RepID=UPI000209AB3C|nr:hypothetical protein [Pyrococcus sp. NA2]AEC51446.1 hypothetical protein PNA2_0530 [Pyrococcus sp. NA2]